MVKDKKKNEAFHNEILDTRKNFVNMKKFRDLAGISNLRVVPRGKMSEIPNTDLKPKSKNVNSGIRDPGKIPSHWYLFASSL